MNEKYEKVFCTEEGKKVLADLLIFCGFHREKPNDTNTLLRVIGREDVGLHIMRRLSAKPELFKLLDEISLSNLHNKEEEF